MTANDTWKALRTPSDRTCDNCKHVWGIVGDRYGCYEMVGECLDFLSKSKWEWNGKKNVK